MALRAGSNDRIGKDQPVRPDILSAFRACFFVYLFPVPENSQAGGQMAASGKAAHCDLVFIQLHLLSMGP